MEITTKRLIKHANDYLDETLNQHWQRGRDATIHVCDFTLYIGVLENANVESIKQWVKSRYKEARIGEYL